MVERFDYIAANPPVSDKDLEELRRWITESGFPDTELAADYIAFLRESNGGDFMKNDREFQMLAAKEIPDYYDMYKFSVYMPYALPIAMDGCGDLYVFNKREKGDNRVYLVSAGNMGWDEDECQLFAECFSDCVSGKFLIE